MTRIATLFFFLLLVHSAFTAGEQFMPLSEVKPGMRGVGKTIFSGTEIESFDFEVLDVIPNFRAKRDLILVQLIGEKVAHTSVVAGMSGSPMYIEGKLIGALSYRLGLFSKDPVAGVTPIGQMLEILDREEVRHQELAAGRGFNPDYLEIAVGAQEWQFEAFVPPYMRASKAASPARSDLVHLKIPLVFSGFGSRSMAMPNELFSNLGFELTHSGGSASTAEPNDTEPLGPGSAYAVVLADGDLGIQATGTVTMVDGAQVIGMGHPFLNRGAVGLPMAKARILTTLSSWMSSTKMSALTGIVGTVHQDRATGVMGISGEKPAMIPFKVNFDSEFAAPMQFDFRIAKDRSLYSLTPLIFSIILNNALESARLSKSDQTLKLTGQIALAGYDAIPLRNYYAGSTPSNFVTDANEAAGELGAILGALLSNNFESPEITSVDLKFEALPQKYLGLVDRIEVDRTIVAPGDEVTVTAFVREYQGDLHRIKHKLKIPENIRAKRINIFAGGGATLTRLEARKSPQRFRPKTFEQLIRILNDRRKNNYVFFQVLLPDRGIQIEGEPLPGLPPSIRSVIRGQKASGSVVALSDRVLVESKIETDFSVSGGRALWLKVKQKRK